MKAYVLGILLLSTFSLAGQSLTQTIRGIVVDGDTEFPLPGAAIVVRADSAGFHGTTTDETGHFRLEKTPTGRHTLRISFIGYEEQILRDVVVTSAKEVVLKIAMQESVVSLDAVTVSSSQGGNASHEMAMVSARSFTIEETERYAGSRGDPARMASNFAGVQGADDSRNDIVIRGNSPQAVLWRMEGVNIPNPNHFNIPGTGGGPVCMINNKTLANSDFFTGAFPAEYGNSISGVFDLKLRNGNDEKHEFSGQFGFLGTELFAEGPVTKKRRSSYLASYRYSTLAIFNKLGVDIGTSAVPQYDDFSFKVNLPVGNKSQVSVFALGGRSKIDILISEQEEPDRNIYGENDRDQYFKSRAGIAGLSYKNPINSANLFMATLAVSGERTDAHHDYVYRHLTTDNRYVLDSLKPMLQYRFTQNKVSAFLLHTKKSENRMVFDFGLNADLYLFDFRDSVRNISEGSAGYLTWRTRWNARSHSLLLQPFAQWKYNVSEKLNVTAGIHAQYYSMTGSFQPVEPRAGVQFRVNDRTSVNLGIGLHSQIQPTYLYFYGQTNDIGGNPIPHNRKMDFTRSLHIVPGYTRTLSADLRLKIEAYYQHIYDVPTEKKTSSFSLLNSGAGFTRFFPDTLVNEGRGKNYGVEVTLEKSFSNRYLFLVTGSLFESKYHGSDRIWRDTDFNGNYILNMLTTKEWVLRKRNTLSLGGKLTTAGGRRYGEVDIPASQENKEVVWVDETRNSLQFPPYFRFDVRLSYRMNREKTSHELALDLVNIFNTRNTLKLTYAPDDLGSDTVRREYQLGFLPLMYYRVDF